MVKAAKLRYMGVHYKGFAVLEDGRVFRQLKSRSPDGRPKWKALTRHSRGDGYFGYNVKHPKTGNRKWIMEHVAVHESFNGRPSIDLLACHIAGTKRSDGKLGSVEWGTHRKNRLDRWRDDTHSTGMATAPGKLSGRVELLLAWHDEGMSEKELAELLEVSRQAVRYHLKKHGRIR